MLVVPTGVYPVPNVTTEHRGLDLAAALVLLLIFTRVSERGMLLVPGLLCAQRGQWPRPRGFLCRCGANLASPPLSRGSRGVPIVACLPLLPLVNL